MVAIQDLEMRVNCRMCGKEYKIHVTKSDYDRWQNGEVIQKAMPYLVVEDRELLISQTCGTCWNKMFSEEEE